MSKKINAGDTLTVGGLTDDHLGAVIEVETLVGITYRFTLGAFGDDWYSQKSLWTSKVLVGNFYPSTQVTVITPPPVMQPDEPTALGQCIRIEGDDDWLGIVVDPQDERGLIMDTDGGWWYWGSVLSRAGDRQIVVSDPPRWPDETPDVPERPWAVEHIEAGEWPDDDTHLRAWGWIDRYGIRWCWYDKEIRRAGWAWTPDALCRPKPASGPWTRGERVK